MITGDNQLTAAFIGKELKFGNSDESLFASKVNNTGNNQIEWSDIDEKLVAKTSTAKEVLSLTNKYMLCISGDVLDAISHFKEVSKILECIHIFSRTSPN